MTEYFKKHIILLLGLITLSHTVVQSQRIFFSPLEKRFELNEEQIRFIKQIPDGRLIVFTESTINIFNGGGFKTIDAGDECRIPIVNYSGYYYGYVTQGKLWVKDQKRLTVIDLSREQGETASLSFLKELGFPEAPADFFVDANNDLWLLSGNNKLYCYNSTKGKVSIFLNSTDYGSPVPDPLFDIVSAGDFLYLFYQSGIMRCLGRHDAREYYRKNLQEIGSGRYDLRLHVKSVGKYLYVVRNGKGGGQLIRFDTDTHQTDLLIQSRPSWLNVLETDEKGNLWLPAQVGIWYFPAGEINGIYYPGLPLKDGGVEDNEVSCMVFDKQGGLWAGTFNKGLYYYNPASSKFITMDRFSFEQKKGEDLRVYSFAESGRNLLAGTLNGLYKAERNSEGFMPFKNILAAREVRSLFKSKSGNLWAASSNGLFSLEENGQIKKHNDIPVRSVVENKMGKLLLGTYSNGLMELDESNDSLTSIIGKGLLPDIIQVISWKNYIAGISGRRLFFADKENYSVYFSTDKPGENTVLPFIKHYFSCLATDNENLLWMGTFNGLYVWDFKARKLYLLNTANGLINNNIKSIIRAADNSVWITTARGISNIFKVATDTGYQFKMYNYNRYDGVMEHTFSERASYVTSGGELVFGGVDGVNILKNSEGDIKSKALPPLLYNLKLFGKVVKEGESYNGNIILKNALASTDTIILNYKQNFFSLSFSGNNYANPLKTFYKYRLRGIDNDWRTDRSVSGLGEASYTNLPHGEYIFELMASSDGVEWTEQPRVLFIKITPPFWLTIYAKISYVLATVLIIGFIMKRVRRAHELKTQQQQKDAVEKAKSEFITNISHELRTPLTLISTPLKSLIAKVSNDDIRTDLQRISSNADVLLDNINQLLEFKKTEETTETLHLKYVTDLSFLQKLCDTYEEIAKEKQIKFNTSFHYSAPEFWLDTPKIVRLVTNLISNAFKFTPAGGIVNVNVSVDDRESCLSIIVRDTGVGIPLADQEKIFDRFYQSDNQLLPNTGSGIGLFMVKQYAELHGGSVAVLSNPGQGSQFEVLLPIKEFKPQQDFENINSKDRKKILIVEDYEGLRQFLKRELEDIYTVVTAENGETGLRAALEQHPDLIVTDMMMPAMSGDELCKSIRNHVSISHTPIIMLTARTSDQARFASYEAGADAYLVKPFDMELLRLRIRKLLQMFESRRMLFSSDKEVKIEDITSNPLDKELMEKALQFVNENLSNQEYSVEKFSSDMCMDRTGLYRKLMALTGQSPTNFIRTIRLIKAAELLVQRKMSVSDVADEVGFNSVSYFSKCFHEKFGKTPSQYLENN